MATFTNSTSTSAQAKVTPVGGSWQQFRQLLAHAIPVFVWASIVTPILVFESTAALILILVVALFTELIAAHHTSGAITASGFLAPFAVLTWGLEGGMVIVATSTLIGDGVVRKLPVGLVIWHTALLAIMVTAGAIAAGSVPALGALEPAVKASPFVWLAIYAVWSRGQICSGASRFACMAGPAIIAVIFAAITSPYWLQFISPNIQPWVEAVARGMAFAAAFMLADFVLATFQARSRGGSAGTAFWSEHLPLLFTRYSAHAAAGSLAAYWYLVDGDTALIVAAGFVVLAQLTISSHQRLGEVTESVMGALGAAIDARDPYTAGHSLRVADYAAQFGVYLGWSRGRVERLRKAALLHDVGKIGVSDLVLFKPGRLEPHEFEEMKRHASVGETVVMRIAGLADVARIAGQDHERWAGGGYPRGLKGEEIVPEARLLAIVDVFDAMTTTRPYREALGEEAALAHLESVAGDQLDPTLTETFVERVRESRESGVLFCYCATH